MSADESSITTQTGTGAIQLGEEEETVREGEAADRPAPGQVFSHPQRYAASFGQRERERERDANN